MNRLTKQISLVLVSSSLILSGCHRAAPPQAPMVQRPPQQPSGVPVGPDGQPLAERPLDEEQKTDETKQQEGQPGSSGTSSSSHTSSHGYYHSGYGRHFIPIPIPMGGSRPSPSPGPRPGFASSSGSHASTSGSSSRSTGSSIRGGFGASSHGVAS